MTRLERYALSRIEILNETMRQTNNGISDSLQQDNKDLEMLKEYHEDFNRSTRELKLIVSCLLEFEDLPF